MIPMEYLMVESKYPTGLNPGAKSGESGNKNRFIRHDDARPKKKINIGPAVVLHLGTPPREYTLGYDRFGKLKKI